MADLTLVDQISEDMGPDPWEDDEIIRLLDEEQLTANQILFRFWTRRSAEAAHLTSISESGSSRSLQQVHDNALKMVKMYDDRVKAEAAPAGVVPLTTGFRSHRIKRV